MKYLALPFFVIAVVVLTLGTFVLGGRYFNPGVVATATVVPDSKAAVVVPTTADLVTAILGDTRFKTALVTTDDQRTLLVDAILADQRIKNLDLTDDKRRLLVVDVVTAVFADQRMVTLLADVAKLKIDLAAAQLAIGNQAGTNVSLQDQINLLKSPPAPAATPTAATTRAFATNTPGDTTATVTLQGTSVTVDLSKFVTHEEFDPIKQKVNGLPNNFASLDDFVVMDGRVKTVEGAVAHLQQNKAETTFVTSSIELAKGTLRAENTNSAVARPNAAASAPVASPTTTANGSRTIPGTNITVLPDDHGKIIPGTNIRVLPKN